jgi:hypothetical protein
MRGDLVNNLWGVHKGKLVANRDRCVGNVGRQRRGWRQRWFLHLHSFELTTTAELGNGDADVTRGDEIALLQ